jgi:hypothetical protein
MTPRTRRRRRLLLLLIVYLLIVLGGAIALWFVIPQDVKNAVRETYFSGP